MSSHHSDKKETTLLRHSDWPVPVYEFVFIPGPRKKDDDAYRYKLLVARAINACISNEEGFTVYAYLLTNRKLCLVMDIAYFTAEEIRTKFYEQLRKELKEEMAAKGIPLADPRQEKLYEQFHCFPFENGYLGKLMTNRKVNPGYYSPHLARLEAYIRNNHFCSVIDYAGGTGPVAVTLLNFNKTDTANDD